MPLSQQGPSSALYEQGLTLWHCSLSSTHTLPCDLEGVELMALIERGKKGMHPAEDCMVQPVPGEVVQGCHGELGHPSELIWLQSYTEHHTGQWRTQYMSHPVVSFSLTSL